MTQPMIETIDLTGSDEIEEYRAPRRPKGRHRGAAPTANASNVIVIDSDGSPGSGGGGMRSPSARLSTAWPGGPSGGSSISVRNTAGGQSMASTHASESSSPTRTVRSTARKTTAGLRGHEGQTGFARVGATRGQSPSAAKGYQPTPEWGPWGQSTNTSQSPSLGERLAVSAEQRSDSEGASGRIPAVRERSILLEQSRRSVVDDSLPLPGDTRGASQPSSQRHERSSSARTRGALPVSMLVSHSPDKADANPLKRPLASLSTNRPAAGVAQTESPRPSASPSTSVAAVAAAAAAVTASSFGPIMQKFLAHVKPANPAVSADGESRDGDSEVPSSQSEPAAAQETQKTSPVLEQTKTPEPARPSSKAHSLPLSSTADSDTLSRPSVQPPENIAPKHPDGTASAPPKETSTMSNGILSLAELDALVEKSLKEAREDHECYMRHALPRARRSYDRTLSSEQRLDPWDLKNGPNLIPKKFLQETSPFASMKPIQVPIKTIDTRPSFSGPVCKIQQDIFPDRSNKGVKAFVAAPPTGFTSDAIRIPPYTDYLSLGQNVLVGNNKSLIYWPHFDDEQAEDKTKDTLWEELNQRFTTLPDHRWEVLPLIEKAQKYEPYITALLEDIGCDIGHILRFYLGRPIKADVVQLLTASDRERVKRAQIDVPEDDLKGSKSRSQAVLSNFPPSSAKDLALAGLVAAAFWKVCEFTLWYVIRQNPKVQKFATRSEEPAVGSTPFTYRSIACRICHLHYCPFHGEMREHPGSDSETLEYTLGERTGSKHHRSDSSDSGGGGGDLTNYKKMVVANFNTNAENPGVPRAPSKRGVWYWNKIAPAARWLDKRHTFYPCNHEGSCEDAECRCWREQILCEKSCGCSKSCKRRYTGCTCARGGRACWGDDAKCDCFELNRECDADLCGTCGAAEILDPVNRYNEDIINGRCANVGIQRNVPKRTLLGQSEIQGFGLFMGERVGAQEYLGEYKGEIITSTEGNRRGTIYQHLLTNYLFTLNKGQEVDSTRSGNKFRFINNSNENATINCYPRVMLCNTTIRIGMYSSKPIKEGQELFFCYGYTKEMAKDFWERGQKPRISSGINSGTGKASAPSRGVPTVTSGNNKKKKKNKRSAAQAQGYLTSERSESGSRAPPTARLPVRQKAKASKAGTAANGGSSGTGSAGTLAGKINSTLSARAARRLRTRADQSSVDIDADNENDDVALGIVAPASGGTATPDLEEQDEVTFQRGRKTERSKATQSQQLSQRKTKSRSAITSDSNEEEEFDEDEEEEAVIVVQSDSVTATKSGNRNIDSDEGGDETDFHGADEEDDGDEDDEMDNFEVPETEAEDSESSAFNNTAAKTSVRVVKKLNSRRRVLGK